MIEIPNNLHLSFVKGSKIYEALKDHFGITGKNATEEEYIERSRNYPNVSSWEADTHPNKFYTKIRANAPELIPILWPKENRFKKLNEKERQKFEKKIVEEYFKMTNLRAVAKLNHISTTSVRNILKKHKVSIQSLLHDLTGQKFGKLVVLERDLTKSRSKTYWTCQCECGKKKNIKSSHLKSRLIMTCGCGAKDFARNRGRKIKILNPVGQLVEYICKADMKRNLTIHDSFLYGRSFHSKGHCLYHPKLVGTTHEERIAKGLYKKYIKLKKKIIDSPPKSKHNIIST